MSSLTTFSKRLKEARLKAGLTQAQLAKKAHTTAATISSYESVGEIKKASLDLVMSLAQALDVSMDWLCGIDKGELEKGYSAEFTAKEYLYSLVRVDTEASIRTDKEILRGLPNEDEACRYFTRATRAEFSIKIRKLLEAYKHGVLTKDLFETCVDKIAEDYSKCLFAFEGF